MPLLFGAALQLFLLDREDRAHFDLNIRDDAGPSALVDKFDVVDTGRGVGNLQPLVMIDRMIAIVIGLIAAPLILAGWRKLRRRSGIGGQVPELGVLCR